MSDLAKVTKRRRPARAVRRASAITALVGAATATLLALTASPALAAIAEWPSGKTCTSPRTVQIQSKAASNPGDVVHNWTAAMTNFERRWTQAEGAATLTNRFSITGVVQITYAKVTAGAIESASLNCIL